MIAGPKEELIRLSIGAGKRPRYSTMDNQKLAEELDMDLCAKRCPAFRELRTFVQGLVAEPSPRGEP